MDRSKEKNKSLDLTRQQKEGINKVVDRDSVLGYLLSSNKKEKSSIALPPTRKELEK